MVTEDSVFWDHLFFFEKNKLESCLYSWADMLDFLPQILVIFQEISVNKYVSQKIICYWLLKLVPAIFHFTPKCLQ